MRADPRLPRWSEEGSEVPAELRQWLHVSREQLGAVDEVAQLSRGLAARLGIEAGLAGSLAPAAAVTSKVWLAAGRWALWLAAGAGGAAAVWYAQSERPSPISSAQAPAVQSPAVQSPAVQSPAVQPFNAPAAPSIENVPEQATVLPAQEPARRSTVESRAPVRAKAAQANEADLLQRAQRALVDHPSQALALAAEHARLFATGALAEEREVIAIEALRRLGRERAAQQRAARFETRYPNSVHRSRVQATPAVP